MKPEILQEINALLAEANKIRINNLRKSIVLAEEAHQLSCACHHQPLIAKSLSQLAFFFMIAGEHEKSISLASESSQIAEQLNDEIGIADAKYTIASVYYKSDNLHLGLKYLLDCIAIYKRHNEYLSQAKAYKSLGTIYEYFGDAENAATVYQLAIEAAEICGDENMKMNVFNPLSGIYLNQGNFEKATELILDAIKFKLRIGDIRGLGFSYYGKAKICIKAKNYELAEDYFSKCILIHLEMGEKLGLGYAYNKLGLMYLEQNRFEEAIAIAEKCLALFETFKSRMIKTGAIRLLYKAYEQQNKTDQALHYLKMCLADQEENTQFQMNQIVNNYKMIQTIEAKALADKLHIEKAEYIAKAKQDFLSNMSHEIRTPLNAVISIAHLLDEKVDAKTEEAELLGALKYSSNNLLSLVNNILDFSKLEEGKTELEKTTVRLHSLLHNIKNTYASLAENKGLHLVLNIDDKIDIAYALDATKLAQILGNLIGNAIKFTDKGSVTLSVDVITKEAKASHLQFKVMDTGAGIPADFVNKLFDKFSQPKLGEAKQVGGSGLGLAIVKELVALHGSTINVSTTLGKGSVFTFDLLLEPKEWIAVADQQKEQRFTDLQLLIAEDNHINMLVATKILNKWGIRPDTAENGKEALEKAKQKKYDIILMDLHMPVLNGFEATVMIRNGQHVNNETPIYAFTADITADINKEYEAFFTGFLHKPIEIDKLYEVIYEIQNRSLKAILINETMRLAS